MHVLHTGGGIDALMRDVGCDETLRRAADLAVDVDINITGRGDALVVQQRSFWAHRRLRVEHGGQDFVLHLERTTGRFRSGFSIRGNPPTRCPTKRATLSSTEVSSGSTRWSSSVAVL